MPVLSMHIIIIILLAGMVLGYDVLCPDRSQRQLRSRGLCVENSTYTCLEDVNIHKFIESCLEKEDAVRPGNRYVLKGQSTIGECSTRRYQPIKFNKTSGSKCIYLKSTCTEVGQVVGNNGTGLADTTCICDYTEGYAYVTRPADVCSCVPSREDFTCYKVICPQLYRLSADNICVYRDTANMTECATVYKSGKDAKTTMRTDSTAINSSVRKQIRTEEAYITWRIVFTVLIPAILVVIVVLFSSRVVYLRCRKECFTSKFEVEKKCIEGKTCLFKCEVFDDRAEAKWFKESTEITPSEKYIVLSNGRERSLELSNVNMGDAGHFTIKINECFTSKFEVEKKCIEGKTCLFKCEVFDDRAEAKWFKESTEITPSEKYIVLSNGRERSLELSNVNMGDAGHFTIKINGCCISSKLIVQELSKAVKAMSPEDIQQFIELSKSEKMERRSFFRTVIVGQERGGKTYLKRRLLKESNEDIKINPHESTEGVDIDIHNIRIPIQDDEDWILDKDNNKEKGYRIAKALKEKNVAQDYNTTAMLDKTSSPERINTHSNSRSNKKDNDQLTNINEHQNKVAYEAKDPLDDHESSIYYDKVQDTLEYRTTEEKKLDGKPQIENNSTKETKQEPNENDKSIDNMKYPNDVNQEPKIDIERQLMGIDLPLELSKYAFSKLWDFAGQKIYYATHQAFLTSAAIYLLVVNLHDYSEKKKKKTCDDKDEDDFIDVEDYIDFWLDTIYCYSSLDTAGQNVNDNDKTPAELPVVLIICTHTDLCKKAELEALQKKFKNDIYTINEKKTKKTHMDKQIIYISNTQDEDEKFKEIRGRIAKAAQSVKETIPLKWILLEMEIDKLVNNGKKCISVDKIYKLGDDVQMDRNKMKLFLKYQHKIGNVIFFDDKDLEKNVILQPSWIIDMSKCVISEYPDLQGDDYQKLQNKGIIEKGKLKMLLEGKNVSGDNIDHLTDVMKKFDILIPFKNSGALYVPCMIKVKKEIEVIKKDIMKNEAQWEQTSWLCLEFDFLPRAFFHHILSFCIKNGMFKDGEENLYRGTCVFSMRSKDNPEKLAICVSKSKIAIQGWVCTAKKQKFTPGLNSYVRNQLENYVSCIKKRYSLDINYNVMCIHSSGNFKEKGTSLKDLFENHFNGKLVNCGVDNCKASELFGAWYTSFNKIVKDEIKYNITHTSCSGGCYARISHSLNISPSTTSRINESKSNQKDNSIQKAHNICLKHSDWRSKFKDFLKNVQLVNVFTFDAVCTCTDAHKKVWQSVTLEHIALAHFVYKKYYQSREDRSAHREFYSTLLDEDMFCYDTQCSADRLVYIMFSKENGKMVDVAFSKENKENGLNLRNPIPSINLPEYFQRHLTDKHECLEGTDVKLEFFVVDADSDARWEKDGNPISQFPRYKTKHEGQTHILIIENCLLDDSGIYSIEVNNREMSTSLDVKEYYSQSFKKEITSLEGFNVELRCDVLDAQFKAKWTKESNVISESSKYTMQDEGKTHTLIIISCVRTDSGNYSVEVNNRKRSTLLHVEGWPPTPDLQKEMEKTRLLTIKKKNIDVYRMHCNQRGTVFIINNSNFENKRFPYRKGSDVDYRNMKDLFRDLQFHVVHRENLTAKEMTEFLCEEKNKVDRIEMECVVLILMSYGEGSCIYGTDGKPVQLETLINIFSTEQCHTLDGKPRLVFVQTCSTGQKQNLTPDDGTERFTQINEGTPELEIPRPKADFFFAYSTFAGTSPYANVHTGSWFLCAIMWVFKFHADKEELHHLLMMVNRIVGNSKVKNGNPSNITISKVKSNLRKKFYFFPGVCDNPPRFV